MPAWTQQLRISWRRPLVSFVSEKAAILEDIDEAGLLWRYIVADGRVGIKVKDTLHHLIFGPDFLHFAALRPDADMDALLSAAVFAWNRLKPTEVRSLAPEFRFLTPVSLGYDDARSGAGDRVIPLPDGLANVDFAILSDISTEDPGADIKVECGIVHQAEAAQRLAAGQPALREGQGVRPTIFPAKSIPEVGMYDRQAWRIADLELGTWDEVVDLWSRSAERAEQTDVALFEQLVGDAK